MCVFQLFLISLYVRPGSRAAMADHLSNHGIVAEDAVELDDGLLLLEGEAAALDLRPEVVRPPQPAALPATL